MKIAIYARVSSKQQQSDGVSLEAQVDACKRYAESRDWAVVEVVREVMSGRTGLRPKFRRLCAEALNGKYEGILVHKFDRFARNRIIAATKKELLRAKGVQIISVSEPLEFSPDDPSSFLMEGILELFAEWFAINLSQETLKGQLYQIKNGKWPTGAVAFGYKKEDGQVLPNQPYFEQMKWAFTTFAQGDYTLQSWSDCAHQKGIVGTTGLRISPSAWHRMFTNPFYTGKLIWAGVEGKGRHEPIVSQKIFLEIQSILSRNRKGTKKSPQFFLLSGGYLHSEDSDSTMYGGVGGGQRYYQSIGLCRDGKRHYINADKLEEKFVDLLDFVVIVDKSNLEELIQDDKLLMALRVATNIKDIWGWLEADQQKHLISIFMQKLGVRVRGMRIVSLGLAPNFALKI